MFCRTNFSNDWNIKITMYYWHLFNGEWGGGVFLDWMLAHPLPRFDGATIWRLEHLSSWNPSLPLSLLFLFLFYFYFFDFQDWETPRGKLVNPREAAGETKTAPISAWRTIFCANEWNEMQNTRKTDSTFTIFFSACFFVVGPRYHLQLLATTLFTHIHLPSLSATCARTTLSLFSLFSLSLFDQT